MDDTKICIKCGQEKPASAQYFYRRTDTGALRGECLVCTNETSRKYHREHLERHRKRVKDRYDTFGRFRRYGITQEHYERALREQDGKCKLCGASEPGGKGVWHIDHAHEPGRTTVSNGGFNQTDDPSLFRGLLCHRCNISLGHYELLVERVGEDRLMRYLHFQPPRKSLVEQGLMTQEEEDFYSGDRWPEGTFKDRKRPPLVINRIG